tara:strand:- start:890 stop:2047 length:1158 start_codon:yes stop_codon:yes gene_type:complete
MGTPGSSDVGGMNTYLNNLATNLAELDNNVWIFTRSHEECTYVTKPIDSRFKLIHFQIGNSGTDKHDLYDYTEEFAILIREFFNVNCLKIDLIYSHYWLSGIVGESLSESLRIPHFVTFHTMAKTKSKFSPRNFEHPKRQQNEKKVMDSARYIIALSSVESVDIQNLYDIPEEKIIVFPPGVDLQNFYPVDKSVAKEALGMKNHKYILFVGRIDPIKGFEILLEMAQILKKKNEFQLIIVGGGSIRSKELIELQSKIDSKDLSDDVVLVGSVPHQQLKTYYSAVDVFVLTSFYESLGFVILESMACATPVVASNVGGIPTLVDDSLTGFLIDENNPESFAEKVEELLIDNNLNYKMGQEGLKKAKLISWTQMTIQMNSFFEKTIN